MSNLIEQRKNELEIFHRLVELTSIEVDLNSVVQLNPPSPDIICKISETDYGFELTALTDEFIERKIGSNKPSFSNFRIEISNAVERIECKSKKSYSISRVDLVLHENMTPIDDLWNYDSQILDVAIQKAADESKFLRVWLIDFSNEISRCYIRQDNSCNNHLNQ